MPRLRGIWISREAARRWRRERHVRFLDLRWMRAAQRRQALCRSHRLQGRAEFLYRFVALRHERSAARARSREPYASRPPWLGTEAEAAGAAPLDGAAAPALAGAGPAVPLLPIVENRDGGAPAPAGERAEGDRDIDQPLGGLAPTQSEVDLWLDALEARQTELAGRLTEFREAVREGVSVLEDMLVAEEGRVDIISGDSAIDDDSAAWRRFRQLVHIRRRCWFGQAYLAQIAGIALEPGREVG